MSVPEVPLPEVPIPEPLPPTKPARYFPTSGHLLLCRNASCAARGADLLYAALWQALERDGLMYYKVSGTVRLTSSGCLGACKSGPAMCVYREGERGLEEGWYAALDFPLALEVARAVQAGTPLPTAGKYGP